MRSIRPLPSFLSPPWFYGIVSLVAFAPCWLTGRAYFDNDLLAQFGPWRQFLKDRIALGHFPLWNPFLMGGTPFFADPQNMLLYPFHWLTLPFSVPLGLTLFFILHTAWAGWGMHLWLRALGLPEKACRLGALLFSLSGFTWMEIIHPPVLAAFSWLPWVFLTLEKLATGPTPRRGFFAGLSMALLFLCGSFQVFLGGLYGGVVYFIFRAWPLRRKKGLLAAGALLLWGALPFLGQFIPTEEFSRLTDRRGAGQSHEESHTRLSLSGSSLPQLFFPRIGLKRDASVPEALQSLDETKNLWPLLGYLGVWAPFLAGLALRDRRRPPTLLLAGLGSFGLALALGRNFPFHSLLHGLLPGFDLIRVPFRYLYLWVLGFSGLAAFGVASLSAIKPGSKLTRLLKVVLGYTFLLYLIALWRPVQDWRELLALGVGAAGLFLWGLSKRYGVQGDALFQAALVLPLLLSGWACFQPGPSRNFDFKGNSVMLKEYGDPLDPSRMIFLGETYYPIEVGGKRYALPYPQNAACVLGLKNFGGYNPLALRSKRELGALPLGTIAKLGAVRSILSHDADLILPGFKQRPLPPYRVYEWQGPMPYVFAPDQLEGVLDPDERLVRMGSAGFDPYRKAILSQEWVQRAAPGDQGPVRLDYRMDSQDCDAQTFSVRVDRDTLTVFCETDFPGWTATVDGNPAPIFTVDHFLRGLFLKKGGHKVEFSYQPSWWPAVPIGLAAWVLLTTVGFVGAALLGRATSGPSRGPGERSRPRRPAPTVSKKPALKKRRPHV